MAGKWRIDMQLRPVHLEHRWQSGRQRSPRPDKRAMIEAILRRF